MTFLAAAPLPRQGAAAALAHKRGMTDTNVVLYQAEWCPYCARVRAKMTDMLLSYKVVNVPHDHGKRTVVQEVSGQTGIPSMVDGDVKIADDDEAIIEYLEKKYEVADATSAIAQAASAPPKVAAKLTASFPNQPKPRRNVGGRSAGVRIGFARSRRKPDSSAALAALAPRIESSSAPAIAAGQDRAERRDVQQPGDQRDQRRAGAFARACRPA